MFEDGGEERAAAASAPQRQQQQQQQNQHQNEACSVASDWYGRLPYNEALESTKSDYTPEALQVKWCRVVRT